MNKTSDVTKYTNRSYSYRNVWDEKQVNDNFAGFMQKKDIKCVSDVRFLNLWCS